jgi:hypothetical protein
LPRIRENGFRRKPVNRHTAPRVRRQESGYKGQKIRRKNIGYGREAAPSTAKAL